MSGNNHWLDDLAAKHAAVAPESAGMETRLLQEIARLQDELKATSYLLGRYEECINAIWSASSLRMAHKYIAILRNGNKP